MYNCNQHQAMNKPPHISVLRITPRKRFFKALSFEGGPYSIIHRPISFISLLEIT